MNLPAQEKILKNLDQFVCQRCNRCCQQAGFVYLQDGEAEAMAAYKKMELYEFTAHYTDVIDRRQLVLKKQPDEACIFLTAAGCSVHAAKPRQCREFPRVWRTKKSFDYCAGLKKIADSVQP